MIEVLKTKDGILTNATLQDNDSWISLTNPTNEELKLIADELNVNEDFLNAALDPEEVSRFEVEDDQVLILANASFEELLDTEHLTYSTLPIAIILTDTNLITVSINAVNCIEYFKKRKLRDVNTAKKTRFTLQIIYQMAAQYLIDLRKLDILTEQIESYLHEEMKNDYLIELLAVEKNLVYFSTALKRNENVVRKLARNNVIKQYEEDEDLLEDTLIEIQQANEMASINTQIIRSIREAFGAIISNNLNTVMKILASITIILTIPTMVYSFFGMNTQFGVIAKYNYSTILVLVCSLIITYIVYKIMKKVNMF